MKSSLKLEIPGLAILFVLMLCATDVLAQDGRNGGRRQRGGRDRGADDNPRRLLRSEAVQRELEMTEDQIKSIEGREDNRGGNRDARNAELEGLSDEAREEKLREMRAARERERMAELEKILLPQQFQRLKQIVAQAAAQGGARSMINGTLASKLNITDEQKERIEKKAEELQKELDEKIAKLREQMRNELLAELTPKQRDQYKQIMGDTFAFERQQDRGRDRGGRSAGGNRGGRGGNRGGDRGGRDRGGDRNNDADF